MRPPLRLVLTGFMGAGKSTVGPRLASALGWPFVDLDEEIVHTQRASIADLFASIGEQAFRELEREALICALQRPQIVLALGGGALESAASRSLLTNDPKSLMVYLEAPLEELLARCDGQHLSQAAAPRRPVLEDRAQVAERFLRRKPLYEMADWRIDTAGRSPDDVAAEILARWKDFASNETRASLRRS